MKCPSESAESWTSRLKVFISSSVYRTIDPGTSSVVASSSCLVELLLAIFWPRRVHRIFSLSQCRRRKRFFMLLQWFLVHIKTGRNRWLTLKNAFVCHLLKCKLPVPSLDLSVIGVFIHFNRGYCNVGVRWGFFFLFFFERIWLRFYLLRAIVNIPIQALIISPRLLFRKMIISKLELGLPVVLSWKLYNWM